MSGYNKTLALYESDSDEDSSIASGIIAQGIGRRDSMSDIFSLPDDLFEGSDGYETDEYEHLKPSAYNPAGLHVSVGKSLDIYGDSDDDGQSIGDDDNYKALTVGDTRAIHNAPDMDEHSIASDDEFMPAVHLPSRITKNDAHFDSLLSAGSPDKKPQADSDIEDETEDVTERIRMPRLTRMGLPVLKKGETRQPQAEVVQALQEARNVRGRTSVRRQDIQQAKREYEVITGSTLPTKTSTYIPPHKRVTEKKIKEQKEDEELVKEMRSLHVPPTSGKAKIELPEEIEGFSLPSGKIEIKSRGKGNQKSIKLNGRTLTQGDWEELAKIKAELDNSPQKARAVKTGLLRLLTSRITQGKSHEKKKAKKN